MPEAMQDNTYSVEEDDKELVITRGKAGKVIDTESAKELIINAIKTGSNDVLTCLLYTSTKYIRIWNKSSNKRNNIYC